MGMRLGGRVSLLFGGSGAVDAWVTPTDIPAAEAAALRSLYDLTDGASWTNNTNWGTTAVADNWYGINVVGGKVKDIDLNSNNLVGNVSTWDPSQFTALGTLLLRSNALMVGDISGWSWASTVTVIALYSSGVSGDTSGWVISSNMLIFYIYSTSLSGCPDFTGATKMTSMYYFNCSLPQATVDAILWSMYQASLTRTGVNGIINVGGTNAAPSGVYQAAASCPVTVATPGKEIAHELLNDGCNAIANHWATVTITA